MFFVANAFQIRPSIIYFSQFLPFPYHLLQKIELFFFSLMILGKKIPSKQTSIQIAMNYFIATASVLFPEAFE